MSPENKASFRPVERRDMVAVIDLLQSISLYEPPGERHSDIWLDFSRQENVISLVVELDGRPVGFGVVVIEQKIRGGKVGHIEDIVSHLHFRRRGLGRELIEILTQKAFDSGCYKVTLHCHTQNAAFYEKCGFERSGESLQRFHMSSSKNRPMTT